MKYKKPKNKDHFYYYHNEFFHNYFDLIKAFNEKDYESDMHMQEFYEINIITKGKGIHFIEDNYIEAKVGNIFIIPPNVTHGYIGGGGFDVFHILISDKFIQKNINDLQQFPNFYTLFNIEPLIRGATKTPLHLSLNEVQLLKINELLDKLIEFEDPNSQYSSIKRSNYTMILLVYLFEIYNENNNYIKNEEIKNDISFMKVLSYIHENFSKKISIDELSEMSILSRSSFIKKFNKICKMTPLQYITKIRIEASKNMLLNTNYSLSSIANKTGFYDTSHFIHCFQKETMLTPSQYRKENIKTS